MLNRECTIILLLFSSIVINEALDEVSQQALVHRQKRRWVDGNAWNLNYNSLGSDDVEEVEDDESHSCSAESSDSDDSGLEVLANNRPLSEETNWSKIENFRDGSREEESIKKSFHLPTKEENIEPPLENERAKRYSDYQYLEADDFDESPNKLGELKQNLENYDDNKQFSNENAEKIESKGIFVSRVKDRRSLLNKGDLDSSPDKPSSGKHGIHSKAVKKSIISEPKQATVACPGSLRSMKNLAELNKAYKLLVCAANRYLKIANKTLTDKMVEDSSKADDSCSTVTCADSKPTECVAEESLNNDAMDQITVRVRKKQGGMSRQQFLAWVKSHVGQNYDSQQQEHEDAGEEASDAYGDYDTLEGVEGLDDYSDASADDDERELKSGLATPGTEIGSSAIVSPKDVKKENAEQKRDKGGSKNSPRSNATDSRSSTASTTNMPSTLEVTQSKVTLAESTSTVKGKHKQGRTGIRSRLSRKYRPASKAKRIVLGRKFIPVSYLKTLQPGAVTAEDILKIFEGPTADPQSPDNEANMQGNNKD